MVTELIMFLDLNNGISKSLVIALDIFDFISDSFNRYMYVSVAKDSKCL